jgi:hypothetical protein
MEMYQYMSDINMFVSAVNEDINLALTYMTNIDISYKDFFLEMERLALYEDKSNTLKIFDCIDEMFRLLINL